MIWTARRPLPADPARGVGNEKTRTRVGVRVCVLLAEAEALDRVEVAFAIGALEVLEEVSGTMRTLQTLNPHGFR